MAHFQFESGVNECLGTMGAPITRGPMMRWQRKELESRVSNGPLSPLQNNMLPPKTPIIQRVSPRKLSTPLNKTGKTPGKSPKKKSPKKTPNKTGNTPLSDRFIPNRAMLDPDRAHFQMVNSNQEDYLGEGAEYSGYNQILADNVSDGTSNSRILHFKNHAPAPQEGHRNNLKVLYCQNRQSTTKVKSSRHIPQTADKILDAPELLDDYYLNLLDWSADNQIAVVLGGAVYLWNAVTGVVQQLLQMEDQEFVSSISWVKEGNILAVGDCHGHVQLWDAGVSKCLRTMQGHAARVGALSWNSHLLSSGSRSGAIHNHDVRVANHQRTLENHTQEVCGLRWSPDGKLLASGGNDNVLNIWSLEGGGQEHVPLFSLTEHLAAVKALAWCPWQPSILASGGGTADRHIRFWNTTTGTCLSSLDTRSQVCGLCWSREYKEIISGHGFQRNQLTIWKYPNMSRVADLVGHRSRVLHMAQSPDGQQIASLAADETLRVWKCFESSASKQKSKPRQKTGPDSSKGFSRLDTHIR